MEIDGVANYVQPTLLTDVNEEMALWKEEIFGPVLAVYAFDSEQEAVHLANNHIYALAASLWTDNLHRAHRVAAQLTAGTISVNTVDALDVTVPLAATNSRALAAICRCTPLINSPASKPPGFSFSRQERRND